MSASTELKVIEEDYEGPVPTHPVTQTDNCLILSWCVIVYALGHGCYKYSRPMIGIYRHLTNLFNYEHNHLD